MFTIITLTLIALSTIAASAKVYLTHVQQCIKLDALLAHAHTRRRAYHSVRANPPRNDAPSIRGLHVVECEIEHHEARAV